MTETVWTAKHKIFIGQPLTLPNPALKHHHPFSCRGHGCCHLITPFWYTKMEAITVTRHLRPVSPLHGGFRLGTAFIMGHLGVRMPLYVLRGRASAPGFIKNEKHWAWPTDGRFIRKWWWGLLNLELLIKLLCVNTFITVHILIHLEWKYVNGET